MATISPHVVWQMLWGPDDASPCIDVAPSMGPGLFVAVANSGDANRVMTSPDGATWTIQTTEGNAWTDLAWNGTFIVAVAASGTNRAMKSTDGVNWTTFSCPSRVWVSVEYSPVLNLFAAVSFDGYVMTSTDGETWTEYTPSVTGRQWADITVGPDGFFLACAAGPNVIPPSYDRDKIMTSTNGTTWTVSTDLAPGANAGGYDVYGGPWRECVYACNRYIVLAQGTFSSINPGVQPYSCQAMTSTDGVSWTPVLLDASVWSYQIGTGLARGPDRVVSVGVNMASPYDDQAPLVMTSTDFGSSWTPRVPGIHTHWRSVTWGNGTYVAVGDTTNTYSNTTVVMTSPDGITWTGQTAAAVKNWQNVKFFPGL